MHYRPPATNYQLTLSARQQQRERAVSGTEPKDEMPALCLRLPKMLLISCKKQATMEKAAVYPARLPRGYPCRDSESVLCPKGTDTNLSIRVLKHTQEHTHSFPLNEGRRELPRAQHKQRKRESRRGSKLVQTSGESGVKGQHPASGSL